MGRYTYIYVSMYVDNILLRGSAFKPISNIFYYWEFWLLKQNVFIFYLPSTAGARPTNCIAKNVENFECKKILALSVNYEHFYSETRQVKKGRVFILRYFEARLSSP
jgi:hypothetical protein